MFSPFVDRRTSAGYGPITAARRQLILRPGAIGDSILALPALRHLTAAPDVGYTEIWAPRAVLPLLGFANLARALADTSIDLLGVPGIDAPAALCQSLKSFDRIVSWYGAQNPAFRHAIHRLGVPCRFLKALPPPEFHGHAGAFFACQSGASRSELPRLNLPETRSRASVVIHPFSGGSRKNWPLEHYRELARQLPAPIEWLAGPEEKLPEAQRFTDLFELACWLKGARLYIGNDSGITHLAAAAGVPTVVLFGPTDPARWAPRGSHVTVIRHEPLELLSVTEVLSRLPG